MTPQELKNSILQRAIQGKLVEQRPEEGIAEELYQQIQAEKQALIKAGKIKKEKPLPEIAEEEKPFDIPDSWKWLRLREIAIITGGFAFKSTAYSKVGVRVIRISDFNENGFVNTKVVRHPYDSTLELFVLEEKNILLCMTGGTVGKSMFVKSLPEKMMTNQRVATIKICCAVPEYINSVVLAPITQKIIQESKNSTNDNISMDTINGFLVPLPPLAEQKRIVAKIEELLPLIDRYEAAWSRLEVFNKRFPGDMQKSLLQMAIQGKLVPQHPEEGTGEELYQQIQAEKQALIKSGKIKKDKPLPEITDDEKPFDIPGSWKWVQLGNLCDVVTGRLDANAQKPDGEYAFFTCGVEVYKTDTYAFDCDAVLLGGNNASGDYKMHRYNGKFNAYQRVYVIAGQTTVTLDYIYYVIKHWLPYLKKDSQGTTTRFIKLGQVTGMAIPFPPLAEQKRIVAKLEELLPLCERLK